MELEVWIRLEVRTRPHCKWDERAGRFAGCGGIDKAGERGQEDRDQRGGQGLVVSAASVTTR